MLTKVSVLALAVAIAAAAWFVVPPLRESAERAAACQAIIDQARRQIDNPGSAIFPSCRGTLDDFDNTDIVVFRDANAPEIWHLMGHYSDTFGGDPVRTRLLGDAWRTADGWDADVFVFSR